MPRRKTRCICIIRRIADQNRYRTERSETCSRVLPPQEFIPHPGNAHAPCSEFPAPRFCRMVIMPNRNTLGGIIHTYQKYDPVNLPGPTQPPPDLVSPAMEHMLMFGDARRLTDEELARAIHLDPS